MELPCGHEENTFELVTWYEFCITKCLCQMCCSAARTE